MGKGTGLAAFAFFTALVGAKVSWAQLHVQAEMENVVASKLDGQWEPDAELTKRLGGRDSGKVTFKNDGAVAGKIPAKYEQFLKSKQVFMSGVMVRKEKDYPFVLVEHKGNPYLVYFRERDGEPLGDAESFNVMLAAGKDKQDDLLFIGGDFNNQPFSAYRRVKTDGK